MAIKRILTATFGRNVVSMDVIEESARSCELVFHQLTPAIWRRAGKLIERFGADEALALLDRRAERSVDRRDVPSAVRWRNLMAAIHAISAEESSVEQLN